MPTTVAETDIFAVSFQRPNNGELADAASLLQFLQVLGNSRRYLYNRSVTGKIDGARHGVVGSGSVDDAPAINAAIAEAVTLGHGEVWLPGGKAYRCDSVLALDGRVALKVHKGKGASNESRLIRNHSGSLITLTNAFGVSAESPTVIEGFKFSDLSAANANPMIDVTSGSLTLLRGWYDGSTSAGPFVRMAGGVHAWLRLYECHLRAETGQSIVDHRIGQLHALGCMFKVPNDYSSFLIGINSISAFDPALALCEGNYFDASDQTAGNGGAFLLSGSYWGLTATNNIFHQVAREFTAFTWAASFATARRLVERGNMFHAATRHAPNGDPLKDDSELSLQPITRQDIGSGTTATIPTSRSTVIVRSAHATTAPTITLPPKLYVGQKLRIVVYNGGVGSWVGPPVLDDTPSETFLTGITLPNLGAGQTVAIDLEVMDVATNGAYVWTVVGVSG